MRALRPPQKDAGQQVRYSGGRTLGLALLAAALLFAALTGEGASITPSATGNISSGGGGSSSSGSGSSDSGSGAGSIIGAGSTLGGGSTTNPAAAGATGGGIAVKGGAGSPTAAAGTGQAAAKFDAYSPVTSGRPLEFPRDYGSHPDFRTEWWYITGWLTTAGGESLGFQITFFRTKPPIDPANPSAFAAHQLLIAHCAISDPKRGRLWQDQRIRRAGLGLADAAEGDTHVWIDDWSLQHDGSYDAHLVAENFALQLKFKDTQPPLLNGVAGVSSKGPSPDSASYYYSLPHLQVSGNIVREGKADRVTGEAWFDHEWSSQYLDSQASGWDWIGINLDDGSALMAFRIRGLDGTVHWSGGTLRSPDGQVHILDTSEVRFRAEREWISPRTGIKYPVAWQVRAGSREFELQPLLDDQENDTRLSTGAIYWEGAVRALEGQRPVGRGYLELTGYGDPLKLR